MKTNGMCIIALLAVTVAAATSCATHDVISKPDELSAVLKSIPAGQSRYVTLLGELRPYSGSFPKGSGLSEIAVGSQHVLIQRGAIHEDREAPYLNKTVRARVKISHFPLPDSNPASQITGHWITEILDLKSTE